MKRNECKEKEYAKSEEGGTEGTRNKAMRYLLAEKQTLRWRFAGFGWISESSVGCMWSEESMEAEENRRIQNKTKQDMESELKHGMHSVSYQLYIKHDIVFSKYAPIPTIVHIHNQTSLQIRLWYKRAYLCMYGWMYGCMYVCMYLSIDEIIERE